MEMQIRPLSAGLIADYLRLFDNMVFKDHPHWADCYCYSFHFTGSSSEWKRDSNRASVIDRIRNNSMQGYLAFHDKEPVGWCNANNSLKYELLVKNGQLLDPENDKACSIVCFLIHPEYRGKGIARKLLQRVIEDYTSKHYDYLEAYPGKTASSCEEQYKGPMNLYDDLGFVREQEKEDHFVVRKYLK